MMPSCEAQGLLHHRYKRGGGPRCKVLDSGFRGLGIIGFRDLGFRGLGCRDSGLGIWSLQEFGVPGFGAKVGKVPLYLKTHQHNLLSQFERLVFENIQHAWGGLRDLSPFKKRELFGLLFGLLSSSPKVLVAIRIHGCRI